MEIQQADGVEMLVLPRKRQERIVMEVSKQQSLLSERMRLTRIGKATSYRIVPFPFRLERQVAVV
jgi:hypothetical protein